MIIRAVSVGKAGNNIVTEGNDDSGFDMNKRSMGAYMTDGDPFRFRCVEEWVRDAVAPDTHGRMLEACEPYAGTCAMIRAFDDHLAGLFDGIEWSAYDINPPDASDSLRQDVMVRHANTLLGMPGTYDLIVTNPPYLARNSARRRGLDFPFDRHGIGIDKPADLYQFALDTCLSHAKHVIALIPESFITSRYDKGRLDRTLSLPGDMFTDTECPVCLAMFSEHGSGADDGYGLYGWDFPGDGLIGTYSDIEGKSGSILAGGTPSTIASLRFNDPNGMLGLRGVDSSGTARISFVPGDDIDPSAVKQSSRSITRISSDAISGRDLEAIITQCNGTLAEWRDATDDVFLTAFKGTRGDGRYRRRLSFAIAARIVAKTIDCGR